MCADIAVNHSGSTDGPQTVVTRIDVGACRVVINDDLRTLEDVHGYIEMQDGTVLNFDACHMQVETIDSPI